MAEEVGGVDCVTGGGEERDDLLLSNLVFHDNSVVQGCSWEWVEMRTI